MELVGEEVGKAEEIVDRRNKLKKALERFVGKKNLTDEQLENELIKLIEKETKPEIERQIKSALTGKEEGLVGLKIELIDGSIESVNMVHPSTESGVLLADGNFASYGTVKKVISPSGKTLWAKPEAKVGRVEVTEPKGKPTTKGYRGEAYDALPDKTKEILSDLGWSEKSLRQVKESSVFARLLSGITPEWGSITPEGTLVVLEKPSREKGLSERTVKRAEKILPEGEELADFAVIDSEAKKTLVVPLANKDKANPDALVGAAYDKSRKRTPVEAAESDYRIAIDKLRGQEEDLVSILLALRDPNLDPKVRELLEQSNVIIQNEVPKLAATVESFRQTYSDLREAAGLPKEVLAGPREGEIKIEKAEQFDDGTGGLVVSEGGVGVDKFYVLQTLDNKPSPAGSVGNKIGLEVRIVKDPDKPKNLEVGVWNRTEDLNPLLEDKILSHIIDRYMPPGKERVRKISRVPGIADDVWGRRSDVENIVRKQVFKSQEEAATQQSIKDLQDTNKYLAFVTKAWKGVKGWKESYSQRKDILESLSGLRRTADPQQFDPDNFRGEVFPEYDKMLGLVELTGDPAGSKIPIIRAIGNEAAKMEMDIQYRTNQWIQQVRNLQGPILSDSKRIKEFVDHVHKKHTSTDPIILEAARNERMIKEDMADVLGAREKGWYLDEYSTIRYDMNKLWKLLSFPFKLADNYAELPDRIKNVMNSDAFGMAKDFTSRYKDWDSMPQTVKDWVQQEIFNFNGVWSNWAYLPEAIQRRIPKKVFSGYMQERTAGDAYKVALDYDYFDLTNSYISSIVRASVTNDLISRWRPIINRLPGSSNPFSVRRYLEKYFKSIAGTKPMVLDAWWNSLANKINTSMEGNILPLYAPRSVSREYIPLLYRGLLGPDTSLRNLTQSIYTMAEVGPRNTWRGFLRYVDERRKKTEEFKKLETIISIPDEFLELRQPIIPMEGKRSIADKMRYVNHKLTRLALHPMKITEHINKGIAYFAGLEEAASKGYDLDTAHIVGVNKASRMIPSLTLTEGQYRALRTTYESQFAYTAAHTSPYLQGAGIKLFTPFWSFPIKTAQMMWNNLLLNPIVGKGDYAWYRFLALCGFMATAPVVTSNLFGVDTKNMWGKGLFPLTIQPAWMQAVGHIYRSVGGDPGSFMETERARDYALRFAGQITIPWYRWGGKVGRDVLNAERGYRTYGREYRPIVETSWTDEIFDIFGFPPSDFREAQDLIKEYKDERLRNMIKKHKYLYEAVDAMEDKNYSKAQQILKEAKEKENLEITSRDVQHAIAKKKDDIWIYTMTSGTKTIVKQPEFQKKFGKAREKFVPARAKSYGTKPMWSSLSQTLEETKTTEPGIFLED